ncbi:hypothetical protein SSS_04652, partial [Sarcoptes scabiei]
FFLFSSISILEFRVLKISRNIHRSSLSSSHSFSSSSSSCFRSSLIHHTFNYDWEKFQAKIQMNAIGHRDLPSLAIYLLNDDYYYYYYCCRCYGMNYYFHTIFFCCNLSLSIAIFLSLSLSLSL